MSLEQLKKDIEVLKRATASENKRFRSDFSKLTDEELLNEINKELSKIGLKTRFTMDDNIPFDFLERLERGEVE